MKKFYYLLVCFCLLVPFGCYKDDVDNLKTQVNEIKEEQIKSIEGQISAIEQTIANLDKTDSDIKSNIQALATEAESLRTTIKENEAQNEAHRKALENQLANIEKLIKSLEEKDKAVEAQISQLHSYIDDQLKNKIEDASQEVKDWATTTFSTLAQMESVNTEIASIKSTLQTISETLGKIISDLNELDTTLTDQLKQVKESLEKAINTRLAETEASIKSWVNEKLEGYLTISKAEENLSKVKTELGNQLETAKSDLNKMIESLEKTQNAENETIRAEIETLRTILNTVEATANQNKEDIATLNQELANAKTELTENYKAAIRQAITESEGRLTAELNNQIADVNSKIDTKVSEINSRIATIEGRVSELEDKVSVLRAEMDTAKQQIADILARIQTISYIPEFEDGRATMSCEDNGSVITKGTSTLKFELRPAVTASELAKVWHSALSVKGVYTKTRAVGDFVNLPIQSVSAQDGILSIVVSGEPLSNDFYRGNSALNARLEISDGKNEMTSDYISIIPSILRIVDDTLIVDQTKFNVPNAGQDIEVKLRHDVDYDLSIDVDWIAPKQTRAFIEEKIIFQVQENTTGRSRIGKITFASKDQFIKQEVTIYQGYEYSEHDITLKLDVKTPGTLKSMLTPEDMRTVTYLIVSGKLNDQDICDICKYMYVLERLDLSETDYNLTSLNLIKGNRLSYLKLPYVTTEFHATGGLINEIDAQNCINLKIVNGKGYQYLNASNCENLTELTAEGKSINASNCSKLSLVDVLDGVETLTAQNSGENLLVNITSKSITEINLSSSTGIKKISIDNTSRQLKRLNLSNCINLSTIDIPAYAYSYIFENLEYLDVSGTNITSVGERDYDIQTDSYSYKFLELPHLKYLNLSNCKYLYFVCFTNSMNSSSSSEILDIDISNCNTLSNFFVTKGNFVNLDFSTCSNLKDINVSDCLNLISIDISKSLNIKEVYGFSCPKLDTIYVWKNFDLSTIKYSFTHMPNFIEK